MITTCHATLPVTSRRGLTKFLPALPPRIQRWAAVLAVGLALPFQVSAQALSDSTNFPVNLAVPDANPDGLASTVTVSTPIQVLTNLQVTLTITNGWNGDLYAYLVHDSGFVVLLNRPGKSAAKPFGYGDPGFSNVTFDDGATTNVHTYRLALSGNENTPLGGPLTSTWTPDGRNVDPATVSSTNTPDTFLSSFNQLNPNGQWTLFVADMAGGDVSTLVSWGLQMQGTPAITITAQPMNTTAECGGPATFSVTATGTDTLHYQWYFNTSTPVGLDSSSLVLSGVSAANGGNYAVVITSTSGSITSQVATLTVQDTTPPAITVLGDNPLTNECHAAFVDPGATATDACTAPTLTTNSTVNPISVGSYTITYVATDGSGNSATNTRQVYVVDTTPPVITQCAPPQTVTAGCNGLAALSDLTSLVVASDACSGSVNVTQQPPAGTAIPAGNNTVAFYVDDGNGNTNTCSTTVTVNANPAPTVTTDTTNQTACAGSLVTWSVAATGTGLTYQWQRDGTNLLEGADNFTGVTTATLTNSAVASQDGVDAAHGYACAITTSGACSVTSTLASLTVNPLPTASVNSATICAGGSAMLTATTDASSPSYLWSPGGATTASITVSPASTTTYTVTVTDGTTLCANSGSGTVTVNPLPAASVDSATICAGGSAMLTATTDASSPSYLWSPGGATTASITVSPASTTTYTVTVTDGTTQCANSGSGTVTVNPLPSTSGISGAGTVSANQTGVQYSVTLTSGSSYAWTVPAGASITSGASGPNNNEIVVTFGTSSGNVAVVETSAAGCVGSPESLAVSIQNPLPVTISRIHGTSLDYTGGAGAKFVLLASPSVHAPMSAWSPVATNSGSPGTFTIPAVGTSTQLYYRIQSE